MLLSARPLHLRPAGPQSSSCRHNRRCPLRCPLLPPALAPTWRSYLLAKELQEAPSGNPLPAVLSRTPLQAALELMGDVLEAHAAAASTAPAGAAGAASPAVAAPPHLSTEHGAVLGQAAACLVALAGGPQWQQGQWAGQQQQQQHQQPQEGQPALLSEEDGLLLHHFAVYLLDLACRPPLASAQLPAQPQSQHLSQQSQQAPAGQQGPASSQQPAGAIDLQGQSTARVARALLQRLCCCAATGLVVLGAAAEMAQQGMHRLVAAVTGEQWLGSGPGAGLAGLGSMGSQGLGLMPAGSGELVAPQQQQQRQHQQQQQQQQQQQPRLGDEGEEEAALSHAVGQLVGILQWALHPLAAWAAEVGAAQACKGQAPALSDARALHVSHRLVLRFSLSGQAHAMLPMPQSCTACWLAKLVYLPRRWVGVAMRTWRGWPPPSWAPATPAGS